MDPPDWLSWSAGLYTDEGFYSLDARHMAITGHLGPGNFHDSLLSPGLSALQLFVFRVFGSSDISARSVSVGLSLATIVLFWFALRRAADADVADAGALVLGLCPSEVFYNRMALQETPAAFCLVASFYAASTASKDQNNKRAIAFEILCGALASSSVLFKPLALIALPGLVFMGRDVRRRERLYAATAGASAILALWFVFHYLPHVSDLARIGGYYRSRQMLPHTVHGLLLNVRRAFADRQRGLLPYLFMFATAPALCACYRILKPISVRSSIEKICGVWLACGALYCTVMVYAPSRYYVIFLPALAGVAAFGWRQCSGRWRFAAFALFAMVSAGWISASFLSGKETMAKASRDLDGLLPGGSIVVGDIGPALCLNSKVLAAPMQPGLSNDKAPIETLHADAIVLIRSHDWDGWWTRHYPGVLDHSKLLDAWTIGPGYRVELYDVRAIAEKKNHAH